MPSAKHVHFNPVACAQSKRESIFIGKLEISHFNLKSNLYEWRLHNAI